MVAEIFVPLGEQANRLFDDTRSWVDPNGRRLSDRLWLARQVDRQAIDAILRQGLMAGADPLQVAKELEDYLTPVGRTTTTRTPRGGKGNFAARRLARTEVTRAFGQATIQAADLNPFVGGVQWVLSASSHKNDDICDSNAAGHSSGLPAGVYRVDEVPQYPAHPHCRCVLQPWSSQGVNDIVSQLRRDAGIDTTNVVPFAPPQRRSSLWEKTVALFRAAKALVIGEAA